MKQNYFIIILSIISYTLHSQTNIAPTASVTISSSFQVDNYTAEDLIDGDATANDWSVGWYAAEFSSANPQYATFDFGDGNAKVINEYHLYGNSSTSVNPNSHQFEARNTTTESWTVLNTINTKVNTGKNEYTFTNTNAYRYYRVLMLENGGASGTAGFQEIELFENTTLSNSNPQLKTKPSVFPNPSINLLTVNGLEQNTAYSVYSLLGEEVLTGSIANKEQINIASLNRGIYILQLENKKAIKFIKK